MGRTLVHVSVRWLVLALASIFLVACTRERPTPPPTPTSAVAESAPAEASASGREPQVSSAAPEAGAEPIITPTLALTVTATPESEETFLYTVQEGETLGSIALKFETNVEVLRELNNLTGDVLFAGQPLYIPLIEGMTAEGAPTPTPEPMYYTIQPGDTLTAIALRFGVDVIRIIEANNLLDSDNLIVGSTILIPGVLQPSQQGEAGTEATPGEATSTGVTHIVQSGEGLLDIAASYGVTVDAIAQANNISDPNNLRVGQELIIPGITPRDAAAARGNIHVVQAGEGLLGIALQYGVTVEEILEANDIGNPDSIIEGQELIIPGD